jgi:hypothetical protein
MLRQLNVFVLVLCWSWTASAQSYDARAKEMRDRLDKAGLTTEEVSAMSRGIDDYNRQRQQCLTDLLAQFKDRSTNFDSQVSMWHSRVAGCRREAPRLTDAIKNASGAQPKALDFANSLSAEEDAFFDAMLEAEVAEQRLLIVRSRAYILEETTLLDERWRTLDSTDNDIDSQERKVREEVSSILDRAFADVDTQHRTNKEKLVNGVNKVVQFTENYKDPITTLLSTLTGSDLSALKEALGYLTGEVAKGVDNASQIYLKTNPEVTARTVSFNALLQSERGGVYLLFNQFREETQRFVEQNGFDKAKDAYNNASNALRQWSSKGTSGQRSDADAFTRDLLAALGVHLSETETAFNDLVSRHKGKFFGPISPEIKEALTEKRAAEDWERAFKSEDLESKLRKWRDQANTFYTVDLSGLRSVDRDYLRGLLRDQIDNLLKAQDATAETLTAIPAQLDHKNLEDELK